MTTALLDHDRVYVKEKGSGFPEGDTAIRAPCPQYQAGGLPGKGPAVLPHPVPLGRVDPLPLEGPGSPPQELGQGGEQNRCL